MKSPPEQYNDDIARQKVEQFIRQHARKKTKIATKA